LGNNVCLSQESYLLTGNHDYKDPAFGLVTAEIAIDEGAWVGARATVCPGVTMASHSILTVGSILTKNTVPYGIYCGNPAELKRERGGNPAE
jgi:putative colanic acid biosynthesis acetyltransferase WcaF